MTEREAAIKVASKLINKNFETYFAGGCVRDKILERECKDIDIATAATPEQVIELFPNADQVGKHFGVIVVKEGGHSFEVATFRSDGCYSDNRRPDSVTFTSAYEDAKRRDFTINALFEHPLTGEIIDFVNGLSDLKSKTIRCVGSPDERFKEDALRIIRCVRFRAQLGFEYHFDTVNACKRHSNNLKNVSIERIQQEVQKILESDYPWSITELFDLNREGQFNDLFEPNNLGQIHLMNHDNSLVSNLSVMGWNDFELKDLKFPNNVIKTVNYIRKHRDFVMAWPTHTVAERRRVCCLDHLDDILSTLKRKQYEPISDGISDLRSAFSFCGVEMNPKPLITGDDLINMGYQEGPQIAILLKQCRNLQMSKGVIDKEDIIVTLNL